MRVTGWFEGRTRNNLHSSEDIARRRPSGGTAPEPGPSPATANSQPFTAVAAAPAEAPGWMLDRIARCSAAKGAR